MSFVKKSGDLFAQSIAFLHSFAEALSKIHVVLQRIILPGFHARLSRMPKKGVSISLDLVVLYSTHIFGDENETEEQKPNAKRGTEEGRPGIFHGLRVQDTWHLRVTRETAAVKTSSELRGEAGSKQRPKSSLGRVPKRLTHCSRISIDFNTRLLD